MVGFGAIYSYAAFADEIATAFGSSRASVSIVYALSGGSCFFVSALTGELADRIDARLVAVTGMLVIGLGFLVAAAAGSLVEVYVGYGVLIGLGCGFAYVPALAAVQRWFDVHRGLASGIAVSGIGVGTALVPPAAEAFSAFGDWRTTFIAGGALAALVGTARAAVDARPAGAGTRTSAAPHAVGNRAQPGLRPALRGYASRLSALRAAACDAGWRCTRPGPRPA
ncbi:MFS transporter [Muricoccus nepalensis]|nr:MFS transporter [Roseomonas nepalensis]